MTELFQEKPNIVHIIVEDKTGKTERWATGGTLEDVLAALGDGRTPEIKRRKRRTKKEIEAQTDPGKHAVDDILPESVEPCGPESVTVTAKKRGRVMP